MAAFVVQDHTQDHDERSDADDEPEVGLLPKTPSVDSMPLFESGPSDLSVGAEVTTTGMAVGFGLLLGASVGAVLVEGELDTPG